jgi:hypothetical protein
MGVLAAHSPVFRFWIDAPADRRSSLTHFIVRGWCVRDDGAPIVAVRARVGTRTFNGVYGDLRPDVHAALGGVEGSRHSGFEIPVAVWHGAAECLIEARTADGPWDTVDTISVDRRLARSLTDGFRWGRFWMDAWRGSPLAWVGLTEDERDYAVARMRVRGWFNLVPEPQHEPRPHVAERFPASTRTAQDLPRLAVVTPSFQQGSFLEQTIRSVVDQQGVRIDYAVKDGGSTDGSVEIIRRYADRLAHWDSSPDEGQAHAVVQGFSRSTMRSDDVMMFLNSDDLMVPGAARFVADYFARHPNVDVVYGHRILIDADGNDVGRWITPRPAANDLRMHDLVPQETLFWRRRLWDRVGGIDTQFQYALDWDLLLRFIAAGARMVRLPWFLGAFRLHGEQKTQTRVSEAGIPEMDRLRERSLGRRPTHDELHLAMRRAQLDSALCYALLRRGWRV